MLLTAGCMIKQLNFNELYSTVDDDNAIKSFSKTPSFDETKNAQDSAVIIAGKNLNGFDFSLSAILILAQTICSCLAGVYNEYLLKNKGSEVNIFVQNVFMYLDSIVCNVAILLIKGELYSAFMADSLAEIFRFKVIIIIVNNAAIGIVTSFFLKYMNSILKTFASALELMFTAVLCYFLFSIPIYINTAMAIAVVSFAIYLYSQSPVINLGKVRPLTSINETNSNSSEKRKFLNSEDDTDLEMDMV